MVVVVYLDFCHAETGTVFVAETAFVTYLDQRSTPGDTEWTHYPFYLDAFVGCVYIIKVIAIL